MAKDSKGKMFWKKVYKTLRLDNDTIKALWILAAMILVLLIWRAVVNMQEYYKYDAIDAAREKYKADLEAMELYEPKDWDHVVDVKVTSRFEDKEYSSTFFNTNADYVEFTMDDEFESLGMRQRCAICVKVIEEVRPRLEAYYKGSEYIKFFYQDGKLTTGIKYRGKVLEPDHEVKFFFYGEEYHYNFTNFTSMVVTANGTAYNQYYKYKHNNGELTYFGYGNEYSRTKTGSSSGSGGTGSGGTGSGGTGSGGTGSGSKSKGSSGSGKSKKTYDPYDSDKYKSPQDFADDKYEEFYDYEDDYDDEDEAYDAAEDYWREHNED